MYLELPLHLKLHKVKKPFALNLNTYRNAHYYLLNKAKIAFKKQLEPTLPDIVIRQPVRFEYTIFMPTKRAYDVANVGSIVDKFCSDVLVECNILHDDNTDFVKSVKYIHGEKDKDSPRAELRVYEV